MLDHQPMNKTIFMKAFLNDAFKHKNGAVCFTHIEAGKNKGVFTRYTSDRDKKHVLTMVQFLRKSEKAIKNQALDHGYLG